MSHIMISWLFICTSMNYTHLCSHFPMVHFHSFTRMNHGFQPCNCQSWDQIAKTGISLSFVMHLGVYCLGFKLWFFTKKLHCLSNLLSFSFSRDCRLLTLTETCTLGAYIWLFWQPLPNCYLFVCLSGCLHRRKETKVSHNFMDSALVKRL